MIIPTWQAVMEGRQTQIRVLATENHTDDRTLAYDAYEWPDLRERVRLPQTSVVFTGANSGDLRIKWQVGKSYAVQPGRGYPAVMWRHDPAKFYIAHNRVYGVSAKDWKAVHLESGWQEARILLTGIRQEHLQDISEEDANAEGFVARMINPSDYYVNYANAAAEYMSAKDVFEQVWRNIHTKSGTRWEDNPLTWVLEFELVEN